MTAMLRDRLRRNRLRLDRKADRGRFIFPLQLPPERAMPDEHRLPGCGISQRR